MYLYVIYVYVYLHTMYYIICIISLINIHNYVHNIQSILCIAYFLLGEKLRGDQQLRNAVIDVLVKLKIGWSPDSIEIGEKFVNQLTGTLWYLDPHHERLASRGIHLPDEVADLQGFNDWQRKKIKQPAMSSANLDGHIQSLSRTLTQPWLAKREYAQLKSLTEKIVVCMHDYKVYLDQKNEMVKASHEQDVPVRVISDVIEVRILEASNATISERYVPLLNLLSEKANYEPIFLNDIAPSDRYQRRHWLDKLDLPFRTMLYRCPYGNHLGVVSFIWKIPDDEIDQTTVSRLVSKLNESQKSYASREMRKEFLDHYYKFAKVKKSVLRNIYKNLTGDCSSASSEVE